MAGLIAVAIVGMGTIVLADRPTVPAPRAAVDHPAVQPHDGVLLEASAR